jgi:sporulation protein YlmC with PRC-barrel domain
MKKTALFIATSLLMGFVANGPAAADSSSASAIAGGNTPSSDKIPKDKRTDLTGGQQGIPDEYATEPVAQGSLKEVKDSKWLNQTVTNKQGEKLGTIRKVIKDEKTQKVEYVFLEIADSRSARPLPWSRFQEQGDKLVLNATKQELLPSVNRTEVKDMSPDLAMFMDEIEQKRAEPKPFVGPGDGRGTNRIEPSSGAMGEEKAAGNLGDRGGPPGQAPGFKNEAAKPKEK